MDDDKFRVWFEKLTFNDGTTITLEPDEVILIVGPNNAGKSRFLFDLRANTHPDKPSERRTLTSVAQRFRGSTEKFLKWFQGHVYSRIHGEENEPHYLFGNSWMNLPQVIDHWEAITTNAYVGKRFSNTFISDLDTRTRLTTCEPFKRLDLAHPVVEHPVQRFQHHIDVELEVSRRFESIFGYELIAQVAGETRISLHIGVRPPIENGEERATMSYAVRVAQLPELELQGDGMKSFAAVLLWTYAFEAKILLVDEPELFLHPPLATQIGAVLAEERYHQRQTFIATHSIEVLRGALDKAPGRVRVIRMTRRDDINIAKEISGDQIKQLWADPFIRYSNALTGIFHDGVVVCESDADCLFYSALMRAIEPTDAQEARSLDLLFTPCGGKSRLYVVAGALRALSIPVCVIADLDVLIDEANLKRIVDALGGDWAVYRELWKPISEGISASATTPSSKEIVTEIRKEIDGICGDEIPNSSVERIRNALNKLSPVRQLKQHGLELLSGPTSLESAKVLLGKFREIGLYFVEVGELERLVPSTSGKGFSWVSKVWERDLVRDPDLEVAREFSRAVRESFQLNRKLATSD